MKCKVCSNNSHVIFKKDVLGKYEVSYHQCESCRFIQTDVPFWLDEAYNNAAISALDVGVVQRNELLVERTRDLLKYLTKATDSFRGIDFGGGHGLFVRMMRDRGYNFYRQDLYAENIFAKYFDLEDLKINAKFDILTAFELFEHLPNPMEDVKMMFELSDTIFFSTELQPQEEFNNIEDWWYLIPETGQHVSFYSISSFKEMARILGAEYFSDNKRLHILTKETLVQDPFIELSKNSISKKNIIQRGVRKLDKILNKSEMTDASNRKAKSLIPGDFEFVKNKLDG